MKLVVLITEDLLDYVRTWASRLRLTLRRTNTCLVLSAVDFIDVLDFT